MNQSIQDLDCIKCAISCRVQVLFGFVQVIVRLIELGLGMAMCRQALVGLHLVVKRSSFWSCKLMVER